MSSRADLFRNRRAANEPTWAVEIFFGIITCQAIGRGSFTSVTDLIDAIRRFIAAYNQRCHLFSGPRPVADWRSAS